MTISMVFSGPLWERRILTRSGNYGDNRRGIEYDTYGRRDNRRGIEYDMRNVRSNYLFVFFE